MYPDHMILLYYWARRFGNTIHLLFEVESEDVVIHRIKHRKDAEDVNKEPGLS
jgi:hypothetical protein